MNNEPMDRPLHLLHNPKVEVPLFKNMVVAQAVTSHFKQPEVMMPVRHIHSGSWVASKPVKFNTSFSNTMHILCVNTVCLVCVIVAICEDSHC